jgi:molecular chaperone DnaJ
MDHYKILGVAPEATTEDIKRAYKKRALEWHPDKKGGSEDKFKQLGESNKILSNPDLRSKYDRKRNNTPESLIGKFSNFKNAAKAAKAAADTIRSTVNDFVGENIVDTIDEILGRKKEPKDIELKIKISLEELYDGADKRVVFKREEPCGSCKGRGGSDINVCPTCYGVGSQPPSDISDFFTTHECNKCKGSGKVIKNKCKECKGKGERNYERDFTFTIPKDLNFGDEKDRLILPKEGSYGGNLLIHVDLKSHRFYEVEWPDLKIELPIKIYQAILGDFIEIDTLRGAAVFKIAPGTEHGDMITLKGYGLRKTDKGNTGLGDLHIKVAIDIPKRVNKKQKALLEAYKENDKGKRNKPKKK